VGSTKKSDLFADVGIKRYSGAEHFIDHAAEWAKTADAARLRGFDLPPYRVEGALFVTDDAGRVAKLQPLALSGRGRRVTHLRRALAELGLTGPANR
jgi:hypothetical protein